MKQANAPVKGPKDYRRLLLAKKSEVSSSLRANLDTLAGPAAAAPEDLAAVFHDQFIALRINGLDYVQYKLIEEALARVESGEYGLCMDCGNTISSGRLEAIPWALRCIACQELSSSDDDSSVASD